MPTFRFYASHDDAAAILGFVFAEPDCRVYEASSRYGEPLRELTSTEEFLDAFPDAGPAQRPINVSLWSPALGPSRRSGASPSCRDPWPATRTGT